MSKRSLLVSQHILRLVERKCLYDNRLFIFTRMLLVMFVLIPALVKERV